jgi:serine phosphatase RsbU (regulator of sigma subunit)
MSMVKSAVRMRLACRERQAELLDDLNDVLKPLLKPNMFVTLAYAAWKGGPHIEIASAGHVPLLHYHASTGEVKELMPADLPLGIVAGKQFASSKLQLESGDLLAIITDGFTETFDSRENEFGMERVKQALHAIGTKDLRHISAEIRTQALAYGEQRDDQTILLIRRLC